MKASDEAREAVRDVISDLAQLSKELNRQDDTISAAIRVLQTRIVRVRPTGYPADVPFPPWGKLGWSGRKGNWRFVVIDDDECEDLLNMPALCRTDACHVLRQLVAKLGILRP